MKIINDSYIVDFDELKFEKDKQEIMEIASNTKNTWQPERDFDEVLRNTKQGKIAEKAVELYFENVKSKTNIRYISYDTFRNDDSKKHAPFDGILYDVCQKDKLNYYISKINNEISFDKYGRITDRLRAEMYHNRLSTVEVKSTKVNSKKKNLSNFASYDDSISVEKLINEICKDDFLSYPKYTRTGDLTWKQYCNKFKNRTNQTSGLYGKELESKMRDIELNCMSDIFIRCYVDVDYMKTIILGFITKEDLLTPPEIKKMIRRGKSENSLYFSKNLTFRKVLDNLI